MSRPAPRDHDFDKEKFANLLCVARGGKTQAKFADDVPMSPTYLSSYVRCRFDRPLMPDMLQRIALASEGRVSFESLLDVSGYDPCKYLKKKIESVKKNESQQGYDNLSGQIFSRDLKLRLILGAAIVQSGIKNQRPDILPPEFDAGSRVFDLPFSNWYHIFLGNYNCYKPEKSTDIYSYVVQVIRLTSINDKVSFITEDPVKFELLLSQELPALKLYISVILVDLEKYAILKESYLHTACTLSNDLPLLEGFSLVD